MSIQATGSSTPNLQAPRYGGTADGPGPVVRDVVTPYRTAEAGIYKAQDLKQPEARSEAGPSASALSVSSRTVCALLAGLMGAMALTGCNSQPPPPAPASTSTTTSTVDKEAQKQLSKAFDDAEKAIESQKSGDSKAAADQVTQNLIGQIRDYAKKTGRSASQVAQDVQAYAISHPAVSITVLLAAGVTSGVVLEKYGVPESIAGTVGSVLGSVSQGTSDGLSAIKDWVQAHPFIAGTIGVAIAATVGYLIYQAVQPGEAPAVPDTPQKVQLVQGLDSLEREASDAKSGDAQKDAQKINNKFMDQVGRYAKATGKSAKEVAEDVKAYMITHPGVSAAVIISAGVGGGILLEKAGVPDKIASVAGSILDSAKSGASGGLAGVTDAIKSHPVLSTAIIGALAAGTGYLIYEHVNAPTAPVVPVAAQPGK